MEEMKKKFPSIPPNYVTLQQLQERRLKEQEQKQREKEELERKLQEQRLKEEQDIQKQKEDEERKLHESRKSQEIKAKASDRFNRGSRRKLSERNRRKKEEIGSETREEERDVVVVAEEQSTDREQKLEESTKKKKKKSNWGRKKKMKPKIEETPAGFLEQPQQENAHEEKMPVDTAERPTGERIIRKECRQRRRVAAKNARVSGETDSENRTVEIARNLGDLTVFDYENSVETEAPVAKNERSTTNMNGDHLKIKNSRSHGHGRKPREAVPVWVKKGEIPDGIPVGFRCSGGHRTRR